MSRQCKLSLCVPTYNRGEMLHSTLLYLLPQIDFSRIEVIIGNNASTDNTLEKLQEISLLYPQCAVYNFTEHTNTYGNICRIIEKSHGDYFLLWGDDDVPAPMLVQVILDLLDKNSNIGCVVFNRIEAESYETSDLHDMRLYQKVYPSFVSIYDNVTDFASAHYRDMLFMSVCVMKRSCWMTGMCKYGSNNHIGFEAMAPMLYGLKGEKCIYVNYPLCIQRHPMIMNQSEWISSWPIFMYVGVPRMLKDMENEGVIRDWRRCYNEHSDQKSDGIFYAAILNAFKNREKILPYIDEMIAYQDNPNRVKILNSFKNKGILIWAKIIRRKIKNHGVVYYMNKFLLNK